MGDGMFRHNGNFSELMITEVALSITSKYATIHILFDFDTPQSLLKSKRMYIIT